MRQKTLKAQRRFIRKLQRDSYEATIKSYAVNDARMQVLKSFVRPRPRWIPSFLWEKCLRFTIKLPEPQISEPQK